MVEKMLQRTVGYDSAFPWNSATFVLAGLALLLVGCERPQAAPAPAPPKVTVSRPVVREVIEWDEYTGRLVAVESVEIRARVSGYLQSIHFNDGAIVKKGHLLFVIDPRPYQADLDRAAAELRLANARLELAKSDYARAQRLLPISGRISRKLVTEGNLINGGTAQSTLLTTIVSLDPIHCYIEADERAYLKYVRLSREGKRPSSREVRNPAYLALADETGFPHKGYIDFVDNRLDPNTGTMTGRAIFPNPDLTLTPGLFARVRIPGSGNYEALMVPDEAIGTDLSQKFVFVVNDQSIAEYRAVQLGPVINGLRVIREGLKPEDWVIVKGIQRARTGTKVEPEKQELSPPEENFSTPDLGPTAKRDTG